MRAEVHRDGTYVDTIFFASKDDLKSTMFTFAYRPVNFGNYRFEIFLEDPYHSSSQFVFETTYVYTNNEESPLGDDPIQTFENDANLTLPIAMVILTLGSGGILSSFKISKKKVKHKLKNFKVK